MGGILTKEFLYLKASKRLLYVLAMIVVILFLLVSSMKMVVPSELASYIGMLMGLMAAAETFSGTAIDEKAKWNAFARSLPVGVPETVGAKYLSMLIFTGAGAVLGIVLELLATGGRANGNALLLMCAVTCLVSILACSVALPLFYRFGYQRTNLIVILLFCVWPLILPGKSMLTEAQLLFLLKLSPVILLAVLAVSFLLSCWIYRRREI